MKIIEVPIEKIKFDKNQPRQTLDHEKIQDMAQSISSEGVINPVELDKNFVIITGELRVRSAQKAGLKTIPAKIIHIKNPEDRYRRQLIENIHNLTMNPWDTAKAIQKLLSAQSVNKGKGHWNDIGIEGLARKIGMKRTTMRDYLNLLSISKPLQKAVQQGTIGFSISRVIKRVPAEIQPLLEKKILEGKITNSEIAAELAAAINRTPKKAVQILNAKSLEDIYKISPRAQEIAKEKLKPATEFVHLQRALMKWIQENKPENILRKDRFLVLLGMSTIVDNLNGWAKVANNPQLTERK